MKKHRSKEQSDAADQSTTEQGHSPNSPLVRASDKHEIMLKPSWPGAFRRTVRTGDQAKVMEFKAGEAIEVTADDLKALKADIGVSLFEIERDEKGRPRFIETVETPDPTATKQNMEVEPGANAENV